MHTRRRRLHYPGRLIHSDAMYLKRLLDEIWLIGSGGQDAASILSSTWNALIIDDIDWVTQFLLEDERPKPGLRDFVCWIRDKPEHLAQAVITRAWFRYQAWQLNRHRHNIWQRKLLFPLRSSTWTSPTS